MACIGDHHRQKFFGDNCAKSAQAEAIEDQPAMTRSLCLACAVSFLAMLVLNALGHVSFEKAEDDPSTLLPEAIGPALRTPTPNPQLQPLLITTEEGLHHTPDSSSEQLYTCYTHTLHNDVHGISEASNAEVCEMLSAPRMLIESSKNARTCGPCSARTCGPCLRSLPALGFPSSPRWGSPAAFPYPRGDVSCPSLQLSDLAPSDRAVGFPPGVTNCARQFVGTYAILRIRLTPHLRHLTYPTYAILTPYLRHITYPTYAILRIRLTPSYAHSRAPVWQGGQHRGASRQYVVIMWGLAFTVHSFLEGLALGAQRTTTGVSGVRKHSVIRGEMKNSPVVEWLNKGLMA
eukprot:6201119-Pyramimonas_sp.AAC.1